MFESVSSRYRHLRRKAIDDDGAAGTEWVVAAAIVVLFAIPVLTLISSGSVDSGQSVAETLEDPGNGSTIASAYAPVGSDPEKQEAQGEQAAEGQPTETSLPGLDMGVGFDITEDQARVGGGSGVNASTSRSGASSSGATRTAGSSSSASRSGTDIRLNGRSATGGGGSKDVTPTTRPSIVFDIRRRDKPETRTVPTREATTRDERQVALATGTATANGTHAAGTATAASDTCVTETRPKFIEREPSFAVGAGLDEELFVEGSGEVPGTDETIFDDDEFRIIDEHEGAATDVDCIDNRALVTAAGEQLGDGTILGMVTISASSDEAPVRRAAPTGLAGRPVAADARVRDAAEEAVSVAAADAGTDKVPAFQIEFMAQANYAAGRAALAEMTAMVEYVAPKAPAVRQSGR